MKIDIDKTGKSFTLYTENITRLTKDQVYGLPVKNDNGEIVGFVSEVDKDYIYIHIFDKKSIDNLGSMEILDKSFKDKLCKLLHNLKKELRRWYGRS